MQKCCTAERKFGMYGFTRFFNHVRWKKLIKNLNCSLKGRMSGPRVEIFCLKADPETSMIDLESRTPAFLSLSGMKKYEQKINKKL
jgi:hypothetical protein